MSPDPNETPEAKMAQAIVAQLSDNLRRKWQAGELPPDVYELPERGRWAVEAACKIAWFINRYFPAGTMKATVEAELDAIVAPLTMAEGIVFERLVDTEYALLDDPAGQA